VSDEELMRRAVAAAREGIAAGQTPFGAVVARGGAVVAAAHNTVWRDTDPTAHAEVNAIRQAAKALGAIALRGCALYTTCEPCPMCLSAIHWAKIDVVSYGARIEDAIAAGFGELSVEAVRLAELGGSPLRVAAGPLREECAALFAEWQAAGLSRPY
jgi:tRNA(Arg) A34 adenosine deaminase TadA